MQAGLGVRSRECLGEGHAGVLWVLADGLRQARGPGLCGRWVWVTMKEE